MYSHKSSIHTPLSEKPVLSCVLYLDDRSLIFTSGGCFPSSSPRSVNFLKVGASRLRSQGQPVHRTISNVVRSNSGSLWCKYVPDLPGQKKTHVTRGEVKDWDARRIEVVVTLDWQTGVFERGIWERDEEAWEDVQEQLAFLDRKGWQERRGIEKSGDGAHWSRNRRCGIGGTCIVLSASAECDGLEAGAVDWTGKTCRA